MATSDLTLRSTVNVALSAKEKRPPVQVATSPQRTRSLVEVDLQIQRRASGRPPTEVSLREASEGRRRWSAHWSQRRKTGGRKSHLIKK